MSVQTLKPERRDMGTWDYFPYVSKFIYLHIHHTTHTHVERERERKEEREEKERGRRESLENSTQAREAIIEACGSLGKS